MKFKKIVILEPIVITSDGLKELERQCEELVIFDNMTSDENETIDRIGDADCVLLSWSMKITKPIIEKCTNLKYIGMCCSYYGEQYSNVDIAAAKKQNIKVVPLKDYGDEGTVESIVAQTISLMHGLNGKRWQSKARELNSVNIGIVGLGMIGGMTARAFKHFGANVYYNLL